MGGRRDETASAKTAAAGAVLNRILKIAGHNTKYLVSCPAALSSLGRKKRKVMSVKFIVRLSERTEPLP